MRFDDEIEDVRVGKERTSVHVVSMSPNEPR